MKIIGIIFTLYNQDQGRGDSINKGIVNDLS